jgi:hypothetical protein
VQTPAVLSNFNKLLLNWRRFWPALSGVPFILPHVAQNRDRESCGNREAHGRQNGCHLKAEIEGPRAVASSVSAVSADNTRAPSTAPPSVALAARASSGGVELTIRFVVNVMIGVKSTKSASLRSALPLELT